MILSLNLCTEFQNSIRYKNAIRGCLSKECLVEILDFFPGIFTLIEVIIVLLFPIRAPEEYMCFKTKRASVRF